MWKIWYCRSEGLRPGGDSAGEARVTPATPQCTGDGWSKTRFVWTCALNRSNQVESPAATYYLRLRTLEQICAN